MSVLKIDWKSPEENPIVDLGTEKLFWIAVDRDGTVLTDLVMYQNRPLDDGVDWDDDFPIWTLHSEDGLTSSVGWVRRFEHIGYDNWYEPITFRGNYQLLAWAEYTPPTFEGVQ